jgi:hypothetical protein
VVLAAGQLLPEVVASGHVTGTRDHIYAAAHRGSTGLLPCRYIILFVQRGETVSNKQFYIYGIYVDGAVRYIGKARMGACIST